MLTDPYRALRTIIVLSTAGFIGTIGAALAIVPQHENRLLALVLLISLVQFATGMRAARALDRRHRRVNELRGWFR